jgi:hypothetical protein
MAVQAGGLAVVPQMEDGAHRAVCACNNGRANRCYSRSVIQRRECRT